MKTLLPKGAVSNYKINPDFLEIFLNMPSVRKEEEQGPKILLVGLDPLGSLGEPSLLDIERLAQLKGADLFSPLTTRQLELIEGAVKGIPERATPTLRGPFLERCGRLFERIDEGCHLDPGQVEWLESWQPRPKTTR